MRYRTWLTVITFSVAAGTLALSPVLLADVPAVSAPSSNSALQSKSGITISVGSSAIISTEGMPPGSEIWAEWYSLPKGKSVNEPASSVKWAYMEMVLDGTAVVSGGPTAMCSGNGAAALATDRTAGAGDVAVCNYSLFPAAHTENGGPEPYIFAALSVGGPWKAGMEDNAKLYQKADGTGQDVQISSEEFAPLEKELLTAGRMLLSIRRVILPSGARIVETDTYPTLRMVEKGQLTISSPSADAGNGDVNVVDAYEMIEWTPEKKISLSNNGKEPVQFVQWSVSSVRDFEP